MRIRMMKRNNACLAISLSIATFSAFGALGCEESKGKPGTSEDGGSTGPNTPQGDCVKEPKTAAEILNQCPPEGTEWVDKNPTLPLLLPDGGLPPIE